MQQEAVDVGRISPRMDLGDLRLMAGAATEAMEKFNIEKARHLFIRTCSRALEEVDLHARAGYRTVHQKRSTLNHHLYPFHIPTSFYYSSTREKVQHGTV